MSKHTPGPWALESVDTSCGSCHKIGPFPSSGVRSEIHACIYADQMRLGIDDGNPVAAELLANARLIAAAPQLLAVLEELSESAAYWSEYDVPIGIVDRINDAIATARSGRADGGGGA